MWSRAVPVYLAAASGGRTLTDTPQVVVVSEDNHFKATSVAQTKRFPVSLTALLGDSAITEFVSRHLA
jgi:hypothetical protein